MIVPFSLSRSPSPRSALLSFSLSFSLTRVACLSVEVSVWLTFDYAE
ncbi:hypothetical protein ACB092_01G102200 [Castanea dentata]